jgi:hypothetical protein
MKRGTAVQIACWGFVALVAMACASVRPPEAHEVIQERTYPASFDAVWTAVIDVAARQNARIETLEKASGLMVLTPTALGDDAVDCGTNALGLATGPYKARMNLVVRHGGGDRTSVRVNLAIDARWTGEKSIWYSADLKQDRPCTSRGVLELAWLDAIGSRLASR